MFADLKIERIELVTEAITGDVDLSKGGSVVAPD